MELVKVTITTLDDDELVFNYPAKKATKIYDILTNEKVLTIELEDSINYIMVNKILYIEIENIEE